MSYALSRRSLIAGLATSAVTLPAIARSGNWASLADRAAALDQLHALIVARDGQPVFEQVFRGPSLDRAVNVKSVSKTIVAALTGAAIDRGEIAGVTATLGEIAPGLIPAAADPRVGRITVEDLVTMRAGLERTSGGNYGDWVSSPNWVADALSRPFVAEPGGPMLYSTGSFHVLGAALSEVAGASLLDLARRRLGTPLGIDIPAWTRDPQGRYLGGNEMALSPRALLRFGEMYRLAGQWQGQTVLSQRWVEASFTLRTRSRFSGLGYGYGWFLGRAGGRRIALARGYGGQIVAVVPALASTIVITSDPTRPARSGGYFGDLMDLIAGQILPAVETA